MGGSTSTRTTSIVGSMDDNIAGIVPTPTFVKPQRLEEEGGTSLAAASTLNSQFFCDAESRTEGNRSTDQELGRVLKKTLHGAQRNVNSRNKRGVRRTVIAVLPPRRGAVGQGGSKRWVTGVRAGRGQERVAVKSLRSAIQRTSLEKEIVVSLGE
ncbi:hypothetical protein GQX74_013660 [Glossina fuscipes]|nr:hypothetical protein GQX74_013660 [Glossina fuscipes]